MNLTRTNVVLAVLAAGLAVPTWLTIQADRTEFTSFEEIPKLFPGFTPDNVRAVVVSTVKKDESGEIAKDQNGNPIRDQLQIARKDDSWILANTDIAGVRVQPDVVREKVFDHLDRIRVDEKAIIREGATPDELREFGLADDQAVLVQCIDAANRPVAQLMIGNDAAGGRAGQDVVRGYYVRSADSSDVILYEQLYWVISPDRDAWVDRVPMRFSVDDVVRVELHNPKGDVALKRESKDAVDWVKESGPADVGAVRNAEVRALVQTLSQIHVQRYVMRIPPAGPQRDAALGEYGLSDPRVRASVTLADGTEHRLAVGNQVAGKNEYYLTVSSVDFLMAVGDWITSPLERDPTGFFDPPASRVSETPPEDGGKPDQPTTEEPPKEQGSGTTEPPRDQGAAPTTAPKDAPTDEPTDAPKDAPTDEPKDAPKDAPTDEPTAEPTPSDTPPKEPNADPTDAPRDR